MIKLPKSRLWWKKEPALLLFYQKQISGLEERTTSSGATWDRKLLWNEPGFVAGNRMLILDEQTESTLRTELRELITNLDEKSIFDADEQPGTTLGTELRCRLRSVFDGETINRSPICSKTSMKITDLPLPIKVAKEGRTVIRYSSTIKIFSLGYLGL